MTVRAVRKVVMGWLWLVVATGPTSLILVPAAYPQGGASARSFQSGQMAELDDQGRLARLIRDDDQDGIPEAVQYYRQGGLTRIERDTDADGIMDTIDIFENGRRTRQSILAKDGRRIQDTTFDTQERAQRIRKDTTGDGLLDTEFELDQGRTLRVSKDTTGDGQPNILDTHREGRLQERSQDLDGDGMFEQVVVFDDSGLPKEVSEDTDKDGYMDLFQTFKNGRLETRRADKDHDGRFETAAFWVGANMERFEEDIDRDGYRETVTTYQENRPVRQTKRHKKTGKVAAKRYFNARGETIRVEKDETLDGRMDVFQTFRNNVVTAIERDRNGDGRIDRKIQYDQGRPQKSTSDNDFDGRFETTQWFDRAPWDHVIEIDRDGSGTIDERHYVRNAAIRQKDVFARNSRHLRERLYYNPAGRLQKSEAFDVESGRIETTWWYNDSGEPSTAARDRDRDGRADIWFRYRLHRIVAVEEDANRDGRKDIWETYDDQERLVLRQTDIDFDGVADIEERN